MLKRARSTMARTKKVVLMETPAVAEHKHALVAPSGMWAVLLCPYTAKLTYDWDKGDTEASKRGSMLHEAMWDDDVYKTLSDDDKKIIDELKETIVKPTEKQKGMKAYYEYRLELKDENGKVLTWGTADYIVICGNKAQLIDWKFGSQPVDKFWFNPQLKCYVAMLYQTFPYIEEVYAMIAQPAVGLSFDNMAKTTRSENYKALYDEACNIVALGENATESDCKPSPDACKWCNKDKCKAYQQSMMSACEAYNLSVISNEDLAELPSAELLAFCDDRKRKCEMVKQIVKEQEAIINQPIINNGGSDNYKVIKPYMRKTVNWEAIARSLGATEEMIEANTTYSSSGEPYLRRKFK